MLMIIRGNSATIYGKLSDASTGEELVGAWVYIKELKVGAQAGLDGSYLIKNIPLGEYTIAFSYISYEGCERKLIVTENEQKIIIDVALKSTGSELGIITITASQDLSSENSARSSEKEAASIINVVSAKAIEISPDLNVANVLQRMSGITLDKSGGSGAQYALMRGMDKRYNYTLVNGVKIPSTNNKHRYVPLDIFPSDLVDRIEVTKAITADMEGDAIGGVVNLVMKNAPEKFLLQTNASIGYSQFFVDDKLQTFDHSEIKHSSPYELNPLGYNASPSDFTSKNLDITTVNFPVNYLTGITIGNRFFNKRLGILFSGNYQQTNKGSRSILFDEDLSRDGKNLPIVTELSDRTFYEQVKNYGLHGKLDYRFNQRHLIKLYIANINYAATQVRSEDETNLSVSYAPEQGLQTSTHSDRMRYNIQNLFNSTLLGEHTLAPKLFLNWSGVYSIASNRTPDEATINYATSLQNFQQVPGFIDFGGSTRRWRYNSDEYKSAYLGMKYTPKLGSVKLELSGGGLYRAKTRTSFYNSYTLIANSPNRSKDSIFYSAKGIDWNKYSEIQWTVRNPRGSVGTSENFDAAEDVVACYGMIKANVFRLQMIGGLRFENTLQGYSMLFPMGERRPAEEYTYIDILPSFHIKYELSSKHNLRASYYKATNKPGFQEIVPFIVRGEDFSTAGNPDIKQASATNLDLRWEYFANKIDQVMLGLFYKDITNPIEYGFVDYLGNSHEQVYSPINSGRALNYGLEFDFTKYKRQWGIKFNYTWTNSNITTNKLSRIKTKTNQDSTIYIEQTRPLYGQSANVGNLSLLYMGDKNGLNAQLAFAYTGERLYTVSRYINNDLWQKGFWQLDFSAEKKFENGLSVFIKAQNLLNAKVIVFIKNSNPENFDKPYQSSDGKETLVRSEYSRATYLLGFRYKFKNKQKLITNS